MIHNILTGLFILGLLVMVVILLFMAAQFFQGWFFALGAFAILLIIANFLGDQYNSGDL